MAIMPINYYGNMKVRQINLINSWGSPAKKNKWSICVRLWKLTVLDVAYIVHKEKKCGLKIYSFKFRF